MLLTRDDPNGGEYPNLKEKVDGSILDYEISCLLDKDLLGGRLRHVLWRWLLDLLSQKERKINVIGP